MAGLLPWTAERLHTVGSFDDVKLLDVRLERLRRWSADGLLLIGDAAHAMSPVGGVGINLAVADAVAAARILAPALRSGGVVPESVLWRVQRRRWWPTALIQGAQRFAHRTVFSAPPTVADAMPSGPVDAPVSSLLAPGDAGPTDSSGLPLPLRLATRFPVLQALPARMVAIGPRPEHAPEWARRAPLPVP